MVRKITDLTMQITAGANVVTVIIMLLIGLSDRLDPTVHPVLAVAGLLFPVFILINICFMFFFAVFRKRYMLITFAGLILSYFPIRTYCPLNLTADPPEGAIKVLSYNVNNFSRADVPEGAPNPIFQYIVDSGADIVCIQEGMFLKTEEDVLKTIYLCADTVTNSNKRDNLMIMSKFPIIAKKHIPYTSENNLSGAFFVKIGTDTVVVINNHFERTGLSMEDRAEFKKMMKGKSERDTMRQESRRLLSKLSESSRIRAPQAEAVARFISKCKYKVILCGDFNDSPISYTRRRLARELTDCYVATGNGPGFSYHRNAMYVRIDNIMCSKDITPYGCKVDRSIGYSDHYPVYCRLKIDGKDKKH